MTLMVDLTISYYIYIYNFNIKFLFLIKNIILMLYILKFICNLKFNNVIIFIVLK